MESQAGEIRDWEFQLFSLPASLFKHNGEPYGWCTDLWKQWLLF